MFKVFGAVMIMTAFLMIGFGRVSAIKSRQQLMELMRKSVSMLKSEISLKQSSLSEAFENVGVICSNIYFCECGQNVKSDGAATAYKRAIGRAVKDFRLSDDEKEVLLTLSDGLGKRNLTEQLSQIDYTLSLVEKSAIDLKREVGERSKLILQGASFIGAATVIILL